MINYRSFTYLLFATLCLWVGSCTPEAPQEIDAERVKVALRAVGNQLLLANQDSTSRVMPVVQQDTRTFKLSFEKSIAFDPEKLNELIDETLDKVTLPSSYLVEVVQCTDGEVAYSYEILRDEENSIISCRGRIVPENCYTIHLKFTHLMPNNSRNDALFILLVVLVLAFLAFVFYSRYSTYKNPKNIENTTVLGSFKFYPEQNKLVKEAQEIPLSKKECELLEILASKPNQVVKRDELTKKVWEDNGVIVGRSLDTYISKLRKKLQDDQNIKLSNVHGVGYKLEVFTK